MSSTGGELIELLDLLLPKLFPKTFPIETKLSRQLPATMQSLFLNCNEIR